MSKKILTRADLLSRRGKRDVKPAHVPALGGDILIQSLTGTERDDFENSLVKSKGKSKEANLRNYRARLLVLTAVGEDGGRLFTEADVEAIGELPAGDIEPAVKLAQAMSAMSDQDVDELVGESKSGQSDDSGSGSPAATASP